MADRNFWYEEDENEMDEFEDEMMSSDLIMQVDHIYTQTTKNSEILDSAIKICEKSWLWSFRSEDFKLNKVIETFFILKELFDE